MLIPYWTRKSFSIFRSEETHDTVRFYKAGYKFVPNFDHWWYKKTRGDTSTHRGLYYTVIAYSNFPHDKYTDKNLHLTQLRISFIKKTDNDSLRLSIEGFEQSFNPNRRVNDTLIFERENTVCNKCVTRILWATNRGIVQIEKSDGTIWNILKN
jgi:hypothetical protein